MENTKKKMSGSSSSSSSFTMDLFGPKDSSSPSSSTGLFNSVFGPPSKGLTRDYSHYGITGPSRNHSMASQYGNNGTQEDQKTQRRNGENSMSKDRDSSYHIETIQPCYFSSSIYYGGQEVYSPNNPTKSSHDAHKKHGDDNEFGGSDSNGASRGNWWRGSLYY